MLAFISPYGLIGKQVTGTFLGSSKISSMPVFQTFWKPPLDPRVTPENIKKASDALSAGSKLVQEFNKTEDVWSITITTNAGAKTDTFKLGEEFSTHTLDGRPVKVVVREECGSIIEVQKGEGFETESVRTVAGDEMTMVLTGNGATSTRKYKKLAN